MSVPNNPCMMVCSKMRGIELLQIGEPNRNTSRLKITIIDIRIRIILYNLYYPFSHTLLEFVRQIT